MDGALLFAAAPQKNFARVKGNSRQIKGFMVATVSVKKIDPAALFLDKLPKPTQQAFLACVQVPLFKSSGWYLAGGTALALQVGHRESVDLDFFSPQKKIHELAVERALFLTGKWNTTLREAGTIYGTFMEVKMSLIAYPFFLPSSQEFRCGTVRILSPEDIAAMKIIAISQRGRKRDFVDLYWYCLNRESLHVVIGRAVEQYPGQEQNIIHILKSLSFFEDAEKDPMPKIFFKATWPQIKKWFTREAEQAAKVLLSLG